ncbi:hypothetical protein [Alkalihalobacillus sp. TS-13]|uniref:hypothetical protein n=1 Tax=Alkalihalobacillus sp. TS-13 TaxID=2842455 RepID=UPI001C8738A1|nr:hypothetical protein [Alkalihalobacillus sp. TS-13]
MKFFIAFITAILTGIIAFLGIKTISSMYIEFIIKPPGGGLEGLSLFLSLLYITPIIIIILLFVYYYKFESWNVRGLLFGAVIGLWLVKILEVWNLPYYINVIPTFSMVIGYFFVRRTNAWLYINGFTIGTVFGFVIAYIMVIVLRWVNNSLTSYFYFSPSEQSLLLITILLTAIIGNLIEKKLKNMKNSLSEIKQHN